MYKIYINGTPLFLAGQEELDPGAAGAPDQLLARYPGKAKFLFNYIDMLEKSDRFRSVTLYSNDREKLMEDLTGHYKVIEAAGGLVFNGKGELLLIFRKGFWDLPKGKIDDGESIEEAAVREVREETGLDRLTLGSKISVTYHTYRSPSGRRILKRTYWFKMTTPEKELTPQSEEDIEKAVWMSIPDFFSEPRPVYGNIRDLLKMI